MDKLYIPIEANLKKPSIVLSPSEIDFGEVQIGTLASKHLKIVNPTTEPITFQLFVAYDLSSQYFRGDSTQEAQNFWEDSIGFKENTFNKLHLITNGVDVEIVDQIEALLREIRHDNLSERKLKRILQKQRFWNLIDKKYQLYDQTIATQIEYYAKLIKQNYLSERRRSQNYIAKYCTEIFIEQGDLHQYQSFKDYLIHQYAVYIEENDQMLVNERRDPLKQCIFSVRSSGEYTKMHLTISHVKTNVENGFLNREHLLNIKSIQNFYKILYQEVYDHDYKINKTMEECNLTMPIDLLDIENLSNVEIITKFLRSIFYHDTLQAWKRQEINNQRYRNYILKSLATVTGPTAKLQERYIQYQSLLLPYTNSYLHKNNNNNINKMQEERKNLEKSISRLDTALHWFQQLIVLFDVDDPDQLSKILNKIQEDKLAFQQVKKQTFITQIIQNSFDSLLKTFKGATFIFQKDNKNMFDKKIIIEQNPLRDFDSRFSIHNKDIQNSIFKTHLLSNLQSYKSEQNRTDPIEQQNIIPRQSFYLNQKYQGKTFTVPPLQNMTIENVVQFEPIVIDEGKSQKFSLLIESLKNKSTSSHDDKLIQRMEKRYQFQDKFIQQSKMSLLIKNNLTLIEQIDLKGQGSSAVLQLVDVQKKFDNQIISLAQSHCFNLRPYYDIPSDSIMELIEQEKFQNIQLQPGSYVNESIEKILAGSESQVINYLFDDQIINESARKQNQNASFGVQLDHNNLSEAFKNFQQSFKNYIAINIPITDIIRKKEGSDTVINLDQLQNHSTIYLNNSNLFQANQGYQTAKANSYDVLTFQEHSKMLSDQLEKSKTFYLKIRKYFQGDITYQSILKHFISKSLNLWDTQDYRVDLNWTDFEQSVTQGNFDINNNFVRYFVFQNIGQLPLMIEALKIDDNQCSDKSGKLNIRNCQKLIGKIIEPKSKITIELLYEEQFRAKEQHKVLMIQTEHFSQKFMIDFIIPEQGLKIAKKNKTKIQWAKGNRKSGFSYLTILMDVLFMTFQLGIILSLLYQLLNLVVNSTNMVGEDDHGPQELNQAVHSQRNNENSLIQSQQLVNQKNNKVSEKKELHQNELKILLQQKSVLETDRLSPFEKHIELQKLESQKHNKVNLNHKPTAGRLQFSIYGNKEDFEMNPLQVQSSNKQIPIDIQVQNEKNIALLEEKLLKEMSKKSAEDRKNTGIRFIKDQNGSLSFQFVELDKLEQERNITETRNLKEEHKAGKNIQKRVQQQKQKTNQTAYKTAQESNQIESQSENSKDKQQKQQQEVIQSKGRANLQKTEQEEEQKQANLSNRNPSQLQLNNMTKKQRKQILIQMQQEKAKIRAQEVKLKAEQEEKMKQIRLNEEEAEKKKLEDIRLERELKKKNQQKEKDLKAAQVLQQCSVDQLQKQREKKVKVKKLSKAELKKKESRMKEQLDLMENARKMEQAMQQIQQKQNSAETSQDKSNDQILKDSSPKLNNSQIIIKDQEILNGDGQYLNVIEGVGNVVHQIETVEIEIQSYHSSEKSQVMIQSKHPKSKMKNKGFMQAKSRNKMQKNQISTQKLETQQNNEQKEFQHQENIINEEIEEQKNGNTVSKQEIQIKNTDEQEICRSISLEKFQPQNRIPSGVELSTSDQQSLQKALIANDPYDFTGGKNSFTYQHQNLNEKQDKQSETRLNQKKNNFWASYEERLGILKDKKIKKFDLNEVSQNQINQTNYQSLKNEESMGLDKQKSEKQEKFLDQQEKDNYEVEKNEFVNVKLEDIQDSTDNNKSGFLQVLQKSKSQQNLRSQSIHSKKFSSPIKADPSMNENATIVQSQNSKQEKFGSQTNTYRSYQSGDEDYREEESDQDSEAHLPLFQQKKYLEKLRQYEQEMLAQKNTQIMPTNSTQNSFLEADDNGASSTPSDELKKYAHYQSKFAVKKRKDNLRKEAAEAAKKIREKRYQNQSEEDLSASEKAYGFLLAQLNSRNPKADINNPNNPYYKGKIRNQAFEALLAQPKQGQYKLVSREDQDRDNDIDHQRREVFKGIKAEKLDGYKRSTNIRKGVIYKNQYQYDINNDLIEDNIHEREDKYRDYDNYLAKEYKHRSYINSHNNRFETRDIIDLQKNQKDLYNNRESAIKKYFNLNLYENEVSADNDYMYELGTSQNIIQKQYKHISNCFDKDNQESSYLMSKQKDLTKKLKLQNSHFVTRERGDSSNFESQPYYTPYIRGRGRAKGRARPHYNQYNQEDFRYPDKYAAQQKISEDYNREDSIENSKKFESRQNRNDWPENRDKFNRLNKQKQSREDSRDQEKQFGSKDRSLGQNHLQVKQQEQKKALYTNEPQQRNKNSLSLHDEDFYTQGEDFKQQEQIIKNREYFDNVRNSRLTRGKGTYYTIRGGKGERLDQPEKVLGRRGAHVNGGRGRGLYSYQNFAESYTFKVKEKDLEKDNVKEKSIEESKQQSFELTAENASNENLHLSQLKKQSLSDSEGEQHKASIAQAQLLGDQNINRSIQSKLFQTDSQQNLVAQVSDNLQILKLKNSNSDQRSEILEKDQRIKTKSIYETFKDVSSIFSNPIISFGDQKNIDNKQLANNRSRFIQEAGEEESSEDEYNRNLEKSNIRRESLFPNKFQNLQPKMQSLSFISNYRNESQSNYIKEEDNSCEEENNYSKSKAFQNNCIGDDIEQRNQYFIGRQNSNSKNSATAGLSSSSFANLRQRALDLGRQEMLQKHSFTLNSKTNEQAQINLDSDDSRHKVAIQNTFESLPIPEFIKERKEKLKQFNQ